MWDWRDVSIVHHEYSFAHCLHHAVARAQLRASRTVVMFVELLGLAKFLQARGCHYQSLSVSSQNELSMRNAECI